MTLPYDYSRCPGARCEVREACQRFTSRPEPTGTRLISSCDFSALGSRVDRAEACENFIAGSEQKAGA